MDGGCFLVYSCLWRRCELSEPAVDEINNLYQLRNSPKDAAWYYFMSSSKKRKPITNIPTSCGNWKTIYLTLLGTKAADFSPAKLSGGAIIVLNSLGLNEQKVT